MNFRLISRMRTYIVQNEFVCRTEGNSGRTLTEMLGILAVIGLLSAAGMGLYAKAMNTLRANHVMDQVLLRHVELANDEYVINNHKTFDISRGKEEVVLSYGYTFGTTSVASITVKGTFSKGLCRILQKRIQDNKYAELRDIQAGVGKVGLMHNPCPDGNTTQMIFVFDRVEKRTVQHDPEVGPIIVPTTVTCEKQGSAYGEACTFTNNKNCCNGSGLRCTTTGICDCSATKTACTKKDGTTVCVPPCDIGYFDENCNCVRDILGCPANKPDKPGASCKYIAGQNCCGGRLKCEQNSLNSENGTCVCANACTGTGQSGERDENCNCKCNPGLSSKDCVCEEGTIYKDGKCVRRWCERPKDEGKTGYGGNGGDDCFIDDGEVVVRCGTACKSTEQLNDKDNCFGFCANNCPKTSTWGQTTWGKTSILTSGLGCLGTKNNGKKIYCGTTNPYGRGDRWICKEDDDAEKPVCCQTKSTKDVTDITPQFGICFWGTCDASKCDEFNGIEGVTSSEYVQVVKQIRGCKVTYKGSTFYCTPRASNWWCYFNTLGDGLMESPHCGAGSASSAVTSCAGATLCDRTNFEWCTDRKMCKDGKKNVKCCPGLTKWTPVEKTKTTIDETTQEKISECSTTWKNREYKCGYDLLCYIKVGSAWERCGSVCLHASRGGFGPQACEYGVCDPAICKDGGDLGKVTENFYGCVTTRTKNILTDNGINEVAVTYGYVREKGCYSKKAGEKEFSICGYSCSKTDCSDCERPVTAECAKDGECLTNGMKIDNCKCPGSVSAGHCCLTGHTYVNGKCSDLQLDNGECVYYDAVVKAGNDYGATEKSAFCMCKKENSCLIPDKRYPTCFDMPKNQKKSNVKRGGDGFCVCKDDPSKCVKESEDGLVCEDCSEEQE